MPRLTRRGSPTTGDLRAKSLKDAPVAQMDRATGFEPVGRRFDPCQARHYIVRASGQKVGHFTYVTCVLESFVISREALIIRLSYIVDRLSFLLMSITGFVRLTINDRRLTICEQPRSCNVTFHFFDFLRNCFIARKRAGQESGPARRSLFRKNSRSKTKAGVAELADAHGLGPCGEILGGSSPSARTSLCYFS